MQYNSLYLREKYMSWIKKGRFQQEISVVSGLMMLPAQASVYMSLIEDQLFI